MSDLEITLQRPTHSSGAPQAFAPELLSMSSGAERFSQQTSIVS